MIAIAQKKSPIYKSSIIIIVVMAGIIGVILSDFILKGIIISCLFLFILMCGYSIVEFMFNYKHIEVKGHRVKMKKDYSAQQYDFSKKDILYWTERSLSHKGSEWHQLHIITNVGKFKINATHYKNYDRIKTALTNGIKHNKALEQKEKRKGYYRIGLILAAITIMLALQASKNVFNINPTVTNNDLVFLTDSLTGAPKYLSQRRNSDIIIFKTSGTNEELSVPANSITRDAVVETINMQKGQVLTFGIRKYEYESKVKKSIPISFYEQHFDMPRINILALETAQKNYLNIEQSNESIIRKNNTFWLWTLLSLVASGYFFVKAVRTKRMDTQ